MLFMEIVIITLFVILAIMFVTVGLSGAIPLIIAVFDEGTISDGIFISIFAICLLPLTIAIGFVLRVMCLD